MWEDTKNKAGGKWILKVQKDYCSKLWEEVLMGIIGDQFDSTGEICGAVISKKAQFDTISIWNAHADNEILQNTIRERIREVLGLSKEAEIEYKKHFGADTYGTSGATSYKPTSSVKYVKKGPTQAPAAIFRSKQAEPAKPSSDAAQMI
eukprot:TRINITY_DN10224_c0_g1_i2.p1 TRINITY_DN10224_c0_g1~~TRINITY_DN10224_c0_g1_i2.p1  ORF type:complete len:149 (-),score=24.27 TRINITY_DN10224_c0_g1_i2:7-453(-)